MLSLIIMGLNIHVHIHHHGPDSKQLDRIEQKIEIIMTKQERFDTILTNLNTVTNDLAADFALFVQEAKDGTISDESLAKAEANVETLKALAASKENPTPTIPTPEEDAQA